MRFLDLAPGRKPGAWSAPRFTSKPARRTENPQRFFGSMRSVFPAAGAAAVQQLLNVKTPGLARSYAGPVARAAPGGPLTW
jgi:hypothetical protein